MQSFLDSVLDDLPEWQADPTSFVFILPSKRAGFFLRSRMAQRAQRTFISPRIWSIEDFVADISGLRYAGQLHLIFRLYEAYQDYMGLMDETEQMLKDVIEATVGGTSFLYQGNEIDIQTIVRIETGRFTHPVPGQIEGADEMAGATRRVADEHGLQHAERMRSASA